MKFTLDSWEDNCGEGMWSEIDCSDINNWPEHLECQNLKETHKDWEWIRKIAW